MAQVTGTVFVKVDGELLLAKEGVRMNLGGFERAAVMANATVVGHADKPVAAEVELIFPHRADTDLIKLNNVTEATVTVETDTGKLFMMTQAFTTEPVELTSGEGDVSITFSGKPFEEIA